MRRVSLAVALLAALPLSVRAEPISVSVQALSNATQVGEATADWFTIDMGQLRLPGPDASATYLFDGLKHGSDYTVFLDVSGRGIDTLRLEVLDPLDDDDAFDPATRASSVPSGYSTSNKFDGFSFAQDSGLTRSAVFAGGSAHVTADEITHRGDILLFSGLSGAEDARVTFGLRDRIGQRGFLVHVSADGGADNTNAPEPASMVLLATGLAGVAAYCRRRLASSRRV